MQAFLAALAIVFCTMPTLAADLDGGGMPPVRHRHVIRHVVVGARAYAGQAYVVAPGPYVVAPPAIRLVVPPTGPRPRLAYAPPPVYPSPPPLIAAVPIVGPYLVPPPYGPPPATVLDAYDHRYDYNQ